MAQAENIRKQFEQLSPDEQKSQCSYDDYIINAVLSLSEVSEAIDRSKLGKSYLEVPNEAMKNAQAKRLLHKFYLICFENGLSPLDWDFGDIKPISKPNKDSTVPLNNRPITLMCCISKMYSSILNARLQKHLNKFDL